MLDIESGAFPLAASILKPLTMRIETKITALTWGMTACLIFLAAMLTRLQIFQSEQYREMAMNNRIRRVSVNAPRGIIYDRNGRVLAANRPSYDVELVLDEVKDLPQMAQDLGEILGLDAWEILKRIPSGRSLPYLPVIVARDVGIEKLTRLMETRKDLSGINIAVRAIRCYPNGPLAPHVLGTLGQVSPGEYKRLRKYECGPQDIVGKTGLELLFNVSLMGRPGGMQVQVDSRGNKDKVLGYKVPVRGEDVTCTLDMDLQKAAQELLAGKSGAIVVLDARCGEVLAMASAPDFDPSIFVESAKRQARASVLLDKKRPLVNRAVSGVYPAGSIFKTIVSLASLESMAVKPDARYYCPGELVVGNKVFHCWRKHGHGTLDLEEALKYSCNVFFYHAGLETGPSRIERVARTFGLGEKTGIVLPGESAGLVPSPEWKKKNRLGTWTKGDTANFSIGQGYLLVTPLQMAVLGAALGNGGVWRSPVLVKNNPSGEESEVSHSSQTSWEISLRPENLEKLKRGMIRVVNDKDATAYSAYLEKMISAGKTGTVQTSSDRASKKDHAWFVGYAPAENPRIVVAVIVEGAGTGGSAAAPLAKELFKVYFKLGG